MDIILKILERMRLDDPTQEFIQSTHRFYLEKGGLSKKQMEGLLALAVQNPNVPPANIATLQAIIKRKQLKQRSPKPTLNQQEDGEAVAAGQMIEAILEKYPQHKRILYLKTLHAKGLLKKEDNDELKRLAKLLLKD